MNFATEHCMNGVVRARISGPNVYDPRKGQSKIEHEPFSEALSKNRKSNENRRECCLEDRQTISELSFFLRFTLKMFQRLQF